MSCVSEPPSIYYLVSHTLSDLVNGNYGFNHFKRIPFICIIKRSGTRARFREDFTWPLGKNLFARPSEPFLGKATCRKPFLNTRKDPGSVGRINTPIKTRLGILSPVTNFIRDIPDLRLTFIFTRDIVYSLTLLSL